MARAILHVDMDAFYAAVEQRDRPELKGKPVIVGADPRGGKGRGVVSTASYEARRFGVGSAMPISQAYKLCPQGVYVPVDMAKYAAVSDEIMEEMRRYTDLVEPLSIDEAFLDVTGSARAFGDGPTVARELKRRIQERTRLTASVGVSACKLVAKIASDLEKPGGLTLLCEADVPARVWPLSTRKLNGIGPKSGARLEALGIRTIGELANADRLLLIEHFGNSYGAWMHEAAHGRDERPVVTYSEPKSISRETTFENDLHPVGDRAQLSGIFTELCVKLAGDLQRKGYAGKTIGLKLRFDNFKTVTRDQTIEAPTQDPVLIRRAAGECLKRVPLDRRIRLLGVRVGALSRPGAAPAVKAPALFE